LNKDYNSNVQNLLRNPKLDLLIAEYREDVLEKEGMFYHGSDIIVLDNPTETEMMLARGIGDDSTLVIKEGDNISIRAKGLLEQYKLGAAEPFLRVYLKEIPKVA
jgi:cyanophycin synthetase